MGNTSGLKLTLRFPLVVKARPHIVQAKGFSPVCVLSCICKALAEEKFLEHVKQVCCFAVRRGGTMRGVTPGERFGGLRNCVVPKTRSAGISTLISVGGGPMYTCGLLPKGVIEKII